MTERRLTATACNIQTAIELGERAVEDPYNPVHTVDSSALRVLIIAAKELLESDPDWKYENVD